MCVYACARACVRACVYTVYVRMCAVRARVSVREHTVCVSYVCVVSMDEEVLAQGLTS